MVNTKELKKRMLDYDLTVNEMADRVGVTPSYMSAVLNGKRAITLKVANDIQEVLEIPNEKFAHYFLDGSR